MSLSEKPGQTIFSGQGIDLEGIGPVLLIGLIREKCVLKALRSFFRLGRYRQPRCTFNAWQIFPAPLACSSHQFKFSQEIFYFFFIFSETRFTGDQLFQYISFSFPVSGETLHWGTRGGWGKKHSKKCISCKKYNKILWTSENAGFRTNSKLIASYQLCLNIFRILPEYILGESKECKIINRYSKPMQ